MAEERRLAAVMFADVVDSTALSDGMDPEDTRALMSRYFAHAVAVVESVGGRLEKFIGDAVVAVFGVPKATGDEAERALKAALELRAAVRADDILGGLLKLRIGVNLGEVMASTDSAAEQFIATGDVMNVAARLQQAAAPDEILTSSRVFLATDDAFEFGESRMVHMKNKAGTHIVYPVGLPRKIRRSERPPMTGRHRELLQFRLIAERVVAESRSRLVTILGVGGIGKTRLAEEFVAILPEEFNFSVVTVVISSNGQTGSDQLRSLIAGLMDAPVTTDRVQRLFDSWNFEAERAARYCRDLMAALGQGGEIGADRGTMLSALRVFVDNVMRGRSMVIVFDGIHNASDMVLDLLEQMASSRADTRALVVCAARTELLDRRPNWDLGRENHTIITLGPLTHAQTQSLVEHYCDGLSDAVIDGICSRSGGNPFFALEFVRLVLQGGGSGVPDNVHAAVLARLDQLDEGGRDLLRILAVAGSPLSGQFCGSLLPQWSQAELETCIAQLLIHDIVQMDRNGLLTIRHSFVQEVAYGTLSRAAAITLHCKIGLAMSHSYPTTEVSPTIVGRHYLAAIKLNRQLAIPVVFSLDSAELVDGLIAAGIASSRAGLALDAREFIEGALSLAGDAQRSELLELLGVVVGVSPDAVASFDAALEELDHAQLDADAAREVAVRLHRLVLVLWLRCGLMARLRVDRDTVLARYLEAHRLASQGIGREEIMRLRIVDLFLIFDRRAYKVEGSDLVPRLDSSALIAESCEIADQFLATGNSAAASEALDGCQLLASTVDMPELALEICEKRVALANLPAPEHSDALAMLARAHMVLGDPVTGLRAIEDEINRRQYGGQVADMAHPLAYGLSTAYTCGQWDVAERLGKYLLQAIEELSASPQDRAFCIDGLFVLACIALARNRREAANEYADILLKILQDLPTLLPVGKTMIFHELRDASHVDDIDLEVFGQQAFAVVAFNNERGARSSPEVVAAAATNGAAYRSGVIEAAVAIDGEDAEALAACIRDLESRGYIVPAARLRIVLARMTGDLSVLAPARRILGRLGDVRFLRRLEQLESESSGMLPVDDQTS